MPEIPYTGVPDRVPQLEPTPSMRVDAPSAAFGGNIAEQIGHLGQVEEGAGKELFDRAYALQEFKVHADVNQRLTDMQNKMTDLTKDYLSQQGSNAVEKYPAYRQALDDARSDGGKGLSQYGQQLYDNESRQWQYRNSLTGADHSAQQLKAYNDQTNDSRISAAKDSISTSPASDANYDANIKTIHDTLASTALSEGWSKEKLDQVTHDVTSTALLDRAHSLAATNPQQARDLLNKAITSKDVSGDRVEKELGYINHALVEVGSRNIANGVMSGAHLQFGEKIVDQPTAQLGIKAIEGGNYTARNPNTNALGAYQILPSNLAPWLKEAGMASMTPEQFLGSREAQDNLFNFKFGQYMQQYGSFNKAAAAWFTGDPNASMDRSDAGPGYGGHTLAQYLQVANRAIAGKMPLADQVNEGNNQVDKIDPGNEALKEEVQKRIETQNESNLRITKDTNFQQAKSVWDAIYQGVGPDHKLPTTPEELQADPAVKQAWDYFATNDPKQLGGFTNALARNARGDVGKTPEREKVYSELIGEAASSPKNFLAEDIDNKNLPISWKIDLRKMQEKVFKNEDAAPQVSHAMRVLGPMLKDSNITKDNDESGLNTFTGTMHQLMTQYQIDNAKPMSDEEITKAGTRLLANVGGQHFWNRNHPWIESITEVPPEAAQLIRQLPQWGGVVPSDNQVLQTYLAKQYQDQFSKVSSK